MRPKKNPNKELNNKKGLYFILGLLLILAIIYLALEWKTEDNNEGFDIGILPKKELQTEDSKVILETQFKRHELNKYPVLNESTSKIEAIEVIGANASTNCLVVEEPPIFPGCENALDKKDCFSKMVIKHFRKKFNFKTSKNLCIQGKIYVQFLINKKGLICVIKTRGPHTSLETEAKRVISLLPKMIPGKQGGSAINVPYSFPIIIN